MEFQDESKSFNVPVEYRLPKVPATGEFLISDYEKYELVREQLFDSPAGRVAGRSGVTVARLWRKNVSRFNERVEDVNRGPSEQALAHGVKVYCGWDRHFYDNYLSSVQEAFICGQYLPRDS
jgi:hypothetical protein